MKKIILLLLCTLFTAQTLTAGDSDTSYSEVRVKKRTSSSGGSSSDDDDESCTSQCIGSCLSSLLEGCFSSICSSNDQVGITINDPDEDHNAPSPSPSKSQRKQITYPWQSPAPVHFSGGLVLGGETYTDSIADAFDIGVDIGITFYPLHFLGIRFSTELLAGIGSMNTDLEIIRYVNKIPNDTLVFTDTKLFNRIIPIKADLLWIFPTDNTPLFISTGGGISYKQEKVTGKEISNEGSRNRTVIFNQWSPTLHFGIGFFSQLGKLFFIPEFRYSLMFNDNKHDYQAPGDVASLTHMFRFCVGICNP